MRVHPAFDVTVRKGPPALLGKGGEVVGGSEG